MPSARVSGNLWSAVSGKKDTRNLWKEQKRRQKKLDTRLIISESKVGRCVCNCTMQWCSRSSKKLDSTYYWDFPK